MALDPGRARVGVAVSDETRSIAQPRATLERHRGKADIARIVALVKELDVTAICIGLPLQMDGREGDSARLARSYGKAVAEATGIPVSYVDERLTTSQVERQLISQGASRERRRRLVDGMAAALILQSALATGELGPR